MSFTMLPLCFGARKQFARAAVHAAMILGGAAFAAFASAMPVCAQTGTAPAQLPLITITGVASNVGSAKIQFTPIAGAQDYRVYDVTDPSRVKYAGQWHLTGGWCGNSLNFARNADNSLVYPLTTVPGNPGQQNGEMITVPAWEVEWNGIPQGQQETLVVEAVDAQGPFSSGNLYSGVDNAPLETCTNGMCMVGSNEGPTLDSTMTTNGQGPSTNMPNVIARSKPFIVGTAATLPIASPSLNSSVFESFSAATVTGPANVDAPDGNEKFSLKGNKPWQVIVQQADVTHTKAFVENGHFMDVLFDGGTPNLSSNPMHVSHGALGISPIQTVEINTAHILHMTMEVDAHTDGRRWIGIVVTPANDPAQTFYAGNQTARINNSNQGLFTEIISNQVNFVQMTGPATGTTGTQTLNSYFRPQLFGMGLKQVVFDPHLGPTPTPPAGQQFQQNARGLDNRSRFDLFLSQTHVAIYEDGMKVGEQDLAQPLGFNRCKVYFTHYVYHTGLEISEVEEFAPQETDWINNTPYSDERHWTNLGYEVLPNTPSEWSSLSAMAQPAPFQAPDFAPGV